MMRTNEAGDSEVERTLRALDGMERAAPKPFFLTRVEARLARRTGSVPTVAWFVRPALIVASLGLALLVNLSAAVYVHERLSQHEQEQEVVGLSTEWGFETTVLDW